MGEAIAEAFASNAGGRAFFTGMLLPSDVSVTLYQIYNLGSTGVLSIAMTPKTHS